MFYNGKAMNFWVFVVAKFQKFFFKSAEFCIKFQYAATNVEECLKIFTFTFLSSQIWLSHLQLHHKIGEKEKKCTDLEQPIAKGYLRYYGKWQLTCACVYIVVCGIIQAHHNEIWGAIESGNSCKHPCMRVYIVCN